jgi:hypothetical protein
MTPTHIGGVIVTAPLWNNVPPITLVGLVKLLSSASYHFADDSAEAWSRGNECLRQFAREVNAAGLWYHAIFCLRRDTPQLVTLEQVIDAVLRDLRERDANDRFFER